MRAKTIVDGGLNPVHMSISGIGRAVVEQQTGIPTSQHQIVARIVQNQTDNRVGSPVAPKPAFQSPLVSVNVMAQVPGRPGLVRGRSRSIDLTVPTFDIANK
jgi:hypothetical protein